MRSFTRLVYQCVVGKTNFESIPQVALFREHDIHSHMSSHSKSSSVFITIILYHGPPGSLTPFSRSLAPNCYPLDREAKIPGYLETKRQERGSKGRMSKIQLLFGTTFVLWTPFISTATVLVSIY